MSAAPLWVPEHLFDEVTPPPKPSPTDWIIGRAPASAAYMIAGCGEYEQECETAMTLAVGETMEFMPFRDFGSIRVEVQPDGSGDVLDPIPEGASSFCDSDGECFGGGIGDVVAQFCEANGKPEEAVTLRINAYDWGAARSFRLVISSKTGQAEFVAVEPSADEATTRGPTAVADLPPSLAVTPNIPLESQTLDQLRLERDHWDRRVAEASGFASAKAADDFRKACESWIARREREVVA